MLGIYLLFLHKQIQFLHAVYLCLKTTLNRGWKMSHMGLSCQEEGTLASSPEQLWTKEEGRSS
jgi:hypothetical protein